MMFVAIVISKSGREFFGYSTNMATHYYLAVFDWEKNNMCGLLFLYNVLILLWHVSCYDTLIDIYIRPAYWIQF